MTTMLTKPISAPQEPDKGIPPLENGDRLTRIEFERRYEAMPHVKRAQLIEGVVYMPSPVNHVKHGRPHSGVTAWLSDFWESMDAIDLGTESTIRLDLDNEPQPDACLFILPPYGGQVALSEDGYIEGAPELVVEVASSSTSIDLNLKLNAYRRNGVQEYIVWLIREEEIRWLVLRAGAYERLEPGPDGVYHSEVFPGLALDAQAMVSGDKRRVAKVQREALNTPEHAAFVAKLAKTAGDSTA